LRQELGLNPDDPNPTNVDGDEYKAFSNKIYDAEQDRLVKEGLSGEKLDAAMNDFEEIDVHKAKELIDAGNTHIVDVRGQQSFEEGHIANAVLVDDSNIEEFVEAADKTKPVVCYCHLGFSSKGASQYFKEKGFETVYSVIGGFTEWTQQYADQIETSEGV